MKKKICWTKAFRSTEEYYSHVTNKPLIHALKSFKNILEEHVSREVWLNIFYVAEVVKGVAYTFIR